MICRLARVGLKLVTLAVCILLWTRGTVEGQDAKSSTSGATQKMGPVGEQDARPSEGTPPVNSVVDPGIIPSRQVITPAGEQSVFESRVFGVVFDQDGNSIYAAALGRKGTHVYQINALQGQSKADALASSKMNWRDPDDVPTEQLDRILWRNAVGTQAQYPVWKRSAGVFQPGPAQ